MRYPNLVPDTLCRTPVTVYRSGGLTRSGAPDLSVVYVGKCRYIEKPTTKMTADKQLITVSGEALFNGDIDPDHAVIEGEVELNDGVRRVIHSSQKCLNPDNSVNYTRLELI